MRYKAIFRLPLAEADFVCALAADQQITPDDALRLCIRYFAKDDPEYAKRIWHLAKADGRGPWRPP